MNMPSGKAHRNAAPLANLNLEVQRVFRGERKTVFSYVGDVDAARIAVVLDHVERLCATVAGEWYVEVESTTPGPLLFRALTHRFTDRRNRGIRERFRVTSTATPVESAAATSAARWFRPFPQVPW